MKYSQEFYDLMHDVKVVRERLERKWIATFQESRKDGLQIAIDSLDDLIKKWEV